MVAALSDRESGRPPVVIDQEKQALREKTERLEKAVEALERTVKIREQLKSLWERGQGRTEKKA
jgi:hypothetical protein